MTISQAGRLLDLVGHDCDGEPRSFDFYVSDAHAGSRVLRVVYAEER